MITPPSSVYFMREICPEAPHEELIKIGVATYVDHRRYALQSQHKIKLRVLATFPGTRKEEQKLHKMFSFARVWPDREWFRPCPEIQAVIEADTLPPLPALVREEPPPRKRLTIYLKPEEDWLLDAMHDLAAMQRVSFRDFIIGILKAGIDKERPRLLHIEEARDERNKRMGA